MCCREQISREYFTPSQQRDTGTEFNQLPASLSLLSLARAAAMRCVHASFVFYVLQGSHASEERNGARALLSFVVARLEAMLSPRLCVCVTNASCGYSSSLYCSSCATGWNIDPAPYSSTSITIEHCWMSDRKPSFINGFEWLPVRLHKDFCLQEL